MGSIPIARSSSSLLACGHDALPRASRPHISFTKRPWSIGGALAFQAREDGFDSRRPLHLPLRPSLRRKQVISPIMAQIIAFPSSRLPPSEDVLPDDAPDASDALRDALAEIVRVQPDALPPLLAVAFADATADLPKDVADRLARESAATLPLLLNTLRAALA